MGEGGGGGEALTYVCLVCVTWSVQRWSLQLDHVQDAGKRVWASLSTFRGPLLATACCMSGITGSVVKE
jgi:hypothetical protein